MKDVLKLELPLANELMTTVRLATGGVCSLAGLGLDESEDCKVCVTESLLLVRHAGFREAVIVFSTEEERLRIGVTGQALGETDGGMSEDEISEALLNALSEDALVTRADGRITNVRFSFSK